MAAIVLRGGSKQQDERGERRAQLARADEAVKKVHEHLSKTKT
jgi:hypothetical protein